MAPDPALDRILAFLADVGLPAVEAEVPEAAFLPGVAVAGGRLVFDRRRLTWPGDLLHEAGHLAVVPARLRPSLDGEVPDGLAPHAGEPEAMAWAYAAVLAIGLDPRVLFHAGGYGGRSESLLFTYAVGGHLGAGGLAEAGMTLTRAQAEAQGPPPYPHMLRWLRD